METGSSPSPELALGRAGIPFRSSGDPLPVSKGTHPPFCLQGTGEGSGQAVTVLQLPDPNEECLILKGW